MSIDHTEPQLEHDLRCPELADPGLYADPDRCTCRDTHGKTPRTPWADGPWLAFDIESTGVDVCTDRIVTATAIIYRPGHDRVVHTWLADPGIDIPDGATEVHGITTAHAREHGRPAADVAAEVADVLAQHWAPHLPLIAYNGSFDLAILDNELRRHHARPLTVSGPVVDPLVIDKHVHRYRKGSRKLVDVCAHYQVRLDGAHDATEDAYAAARVAWRIARQYPEIGGADLTELHRQQTGWFAEQQASFAAYLRKKVAPGITDPDERQQVLDRADDVDANAAGWPLRGAS